MKRLLGLLAVGCFMAAGALAQRPNLNGLTFCIDPGHGGHNSNDRLVIPDPGLEFWESESNFQKALLLRSLLEAKGGTVILTRTSNDTIGYPNPDDPDEPSLTARWQTANANNAHWFHSIHSNAFNASAQYTLLLVRESTTNPGQPQSPEAWAMGGIMSPKIGSQLRTPASYNRLDFTFLGYRLGVLAGLIMPGQLSEGSFHDVLPETRRLLNQRYRKMEAYALRNSFMQYYQVPADTFGIIAGIQTEVGLNRPVNRTRVRLLPANRVVSGDSCNNGFFMFDSVQPGQHRLRFETPGFALDSVTVTVAAGATVFADRQIESQLPPTIVSSNPPQGDTLFSAATSITLQFSKAMNTPSVQSAFSITPSAAGRFFWSNNNSAMVYDPDSVLPFYVNFVVRVESTAQSAGGQYLDGDGNGIPGDPYILRFRTRDVDVAPPQIVATYPLPGDTVATPDHVISINFDERLNPASVTTGNFAIQELNGPTLSRTLQYWESGIRGSVNMYVSPPLEGGKTYRVRVSGVADVVGNTIPATSPILWIFSVEAATYQYRTIENFDTSIVYWLQPGQSGSTVGIDSARFTYNPSFNVPTVPNNSGSGELRYTWNPSASDWLIREVLNSGPPRSVLWRKENTSLQAFVHGDGSRNQFRFCIDDSVEAFPNGRPENREVSRWFPIDWIGWRLVEWDLERDSVGSWTGNGRLEGDLRFDSFQLRYLPGTAARSGRVVFDQLQLARRLITGVESRDGRIPTEFRLDQNYPNPFNPVTALRYALPVGSVVSIKVFDLLGRDVATIHEGYQPAGFHEAAWNGTGRGGRQLASGVYICRLEATADDGRTYSGLKRMMLLK